MSGPWEDYQANKKPVERGPWEDYGGTPTPKSREQLKQEHFDNLAAGQQADSQPILPQLTEGVASGAAKAMVGVAGLPKLLYRAVAEPAQVGKELAGGAAQDISNLGSGTPKEVGESLFNVGAAVLPVAKGLSKTLPPIARKASGAASDLLRESAVRQYSKVLGPTTKENKLLTERVVPELLDKRVTAMTRTGLQAKAEASALTANDALEAAYAELPQDAQVRMAPVLRKIEAAKNKLVVKGTNEIVDEGLYKALNKVQQKVVAIAGGTDKIASIDPTVSVGTARSARQQFDAAVSRKTKIFAKTGKEALQLAANKEAGNAIRHELAQEFPDIAAVNKEVNLWLNVKDVLGDTLTRTASQSLPLGERAMTAGGLAGGLARGGGVGTAIGYATGLKLVHKLINSTAWRTVSAVQKNRLADLLGSGKIAEAEIYTAKLAGGGGAAAEPLSGTIMPDIPPGGGSPNDLTLYQGVKGNYGHRQLTD